MELHHPHDKFFRELFGRPEIAADFLHNYLPRAVVAQLRLDALEPQSESFIDADLQEHFSDLLFTVPLLDATPALVYILFEHKSYSDRLTPFQLLRYMVRIWERSLQRDPDAPLPPILPIVYYHGRTPWRTDTRFEALYVGPEELREYWPHFRFHLTDLAQYNDDEVVGEEARLRMAVWVMKHIHDRRLARGLRPVLHLAWSLPSAQERVQFLEQLLTYLMAAASHLSEPELREIVVDVFSQQGEAAVGTIAETLIQRGIQQGIQQGRQEGRQEGRREGHQEGRREGHQEGAQHTLRHTILTTLRVRFALSEQEAETVTQQLANVSDLARLEDLFTHALQDASLADFGQRIR